MGETLPKRMMTFRRYWVIVNHVVGEDIARRFELYFEVSRGRGLVRRDGSTRGGCAGGGRAEIWG